MSRMVFARARCVLTFTFSEVWKVGTVSCLGPCVLTQVHVGNQTVYPYPQRPPDDGSLYVIADKILEAEHAMLVEVECRPELFMLDRDEDADQCSGFVDAKGVVHADP